LSAELSAFQSDASDSQMALSAACLIAVACQLSRRLSLRHARWLLPPRPLSFMPLLHAD
jgi:hypothetical protein